MEYSSSDRFFTLYNRYPSVEVLEATLYNQYLSVEEKERRVTLGLESVEPTLSLVTASFYTAPRVFWRFSLLYPELTREVTNKDFYNTSKDVLLSVEDSLFLTLSYDDAYDRCKEIANHLLSLAAKKDRDERERVWFFARKYYDEDFLLSLIDENNERWIHNKLREL